MQKQRSPEIGMLVDMAGSTTLADDILGRAGGPSSAAADDRVGTWAAGNPTVSGEPAATGKLAATNEPAVTNEPAATNEPTATGRAGKLPWRDSWRGDALWARFRAAGCHLGISLAIAALVLLIVYQYWYAGPLAAVAGVGTILVLLLAVDVSLGPIMTFLVFDRRKKSLPMDLALIGLVQLLALGYGLHTVEAGRPHYLVFVKDRFEAVSRADLQAEDLQAAADNALAQRNWFGPVWSAVNPPADEKLRQDVLLESAFGGRDLQHFPQWYESLENQKSAVQARAQDLAELRRLNPDEQAVLDAALKKENLNDAQAGYLPLKGEAADAAVLVDRRDGRVLDVLPLKPW